MLQLDLLAVGKVGMAVDFLLEHPQLIPDSYDLVKEYFQRDFLGLQSWIRGMKNELALMPFGPKLIDRHIRILVTQMVKSRFDRSFDKLFERDFQTTDRGLWLTGNDST